MTLFRLLWESRREELLEVLTGVLFRDIWSVDERPHSTARHQVLTTGKSHHQQLRAFPHIKPGDAAAVGLLVEIKGRIKEH